jgi:hypothetical protein
MWPFLTLLFVPLAAAAAPHLGTRGRVILFSALSAFLVTAIGLRYHVGCDWNPYLLFFVRAGNASSLAEALTINSPGYMLVNWAVAKTGLSIVGVNTFCALIIISAVMRFCAGHPKPWLGLVIALPVLILLASFSATRQATAIGFLLFALHLHLGSRHRWAILPLLLVGATFHASLLVFAPILILMKAPVPARATTLLLLISAASIAAVAVVLSVPTLQSTLAYFPSSGGAWFRAVPNLLAVAAYPFVARRLDLGERERSMLFWLAAYCLFCIPLGLASTTLMDRLNWYSIPFQIAVLTRMAGATGMRIPAGLVDSAIAFLFLALFVGWLQFGNMRACVIPYQSYLERPDLLRGEQAARSYKYNAITDPWDEIRRLKLENDLPPPAAVGSQ